MQIAIVPVTGKEFEYNIAGAKYYRVTLTSAQSIAGSYGIPYDTWLTGATNNSEKFPCCE